MSMRTSGMTYVAVAAGGSAGAMLREWLSSGELLDEFFSLLLANVLGCAAIGLIWRFSEPGRRRTLPSGWSIGLMSGLCGALTSYSMAVLMMIEPMALWDPGRFLLLPAVSAACWLAAVWVGLALGGRLNPTAGPNELSND